MNCRYLYSVWVSCSFSSLSFPQTDLFLINHNILQIMGRFFGGLALSGAWCCFDKFNRMNIEVFSVIAQQLITMRNAKAAKVHTKQTHTWFWLMAYKSAFQMIRNYYLMLSLCKLLKLQVKLKIKYGIPYHTSLGLVQDTQLQSWGRLVTYRWQLLTHSTRAVMGPVSLLVSPP